MAAEQYQDLLDSSNDSTALADSHTTDSPTESSASIGHHSQGHAWPQKQPGSASLLAADQDAIATDTTAEQLLPGLAPAAVPAVASRMLAGTKVTVGRRLGSGAFSTVYQAQLGNSNSNKWVVKRLDRVGPDQMQQLSNEVAMLVTAGNHPNLVPFKGWYRDEEGVLCLVLGHCEGGTLATLLKSRSGGSDEGLFPEDMVMCWFVQLLLALHHLHARRILHGDLKPENVLLSKNLRVAKLADFGISKQLQADVSLAVTCLGTPHYMSPEVITHRPYTFASDMWALGVVLYEMAARKPAFDARGLPQLVVKILRNAYTPLPLACSRPLQQLVGLLLRADPDDRPTTTDLLGMSLVRRHLQVLVGLAQGVHRSPAAGVGQNRLAAGADGSAPSGLDTVAAGPEDGTPTPAAAAATRRKSGLIQSGTANPEDQEVDLGNGASLALQDMMIALRRMAKAPLHSGSSSPPPRRTRIAIAAAHGSSSGGNGIDAIQQQGMKRPKTSSSDRVNVLANAAGSRSFSSNRDRAAAGSSSPEFTDTDPAASAGASSPSPAAAAAAAAAYACMPAPVADPNTKRQVVNTWDASAHWEAQQRRQADMRYQAKIMEQRMAREQARQRRKKLDPATAARAAQQQQELEALQHAQQRKQQQGGAAANDVEEISSMSAAAAAAAVAQDEQLELLLQQLRAAAGSGSSSRASPVPGTARDAAASEAYGPYYDSNDTVSDEIEEEEGLLESGVYDDDVTQDEDYTQALALAAAGDAAAGSSSSSSLVAATAVADKTQLAAAGKRAWKLVVASLEEDAFDKLRTPVHTDAAAAGLPEEEEEEDEDTLQDPAAAAAAAAAAAGQYEEQIPLQARSSADADGVPALIQSEDSRLFFSSNSKRSSQRQQQQQRGQQQRDPQVQFDQLEQQLEKALAGSDAATAQDVISSIYRMSLSVRKAPAAAADKAAAVGLLSSKSPGHTFGTNSDTQAGTSGDTAGDGPGLLVSEPVGLWGKKVRSRSAADVDRDKRAAAAMEMVINQMFGNVVPDKQASSEPSTARSLNRTVTGRRVSAPLDTVSMPMTDLSSTGLPEARFQQQQQQELPAARTIPLGSSSAPSSRRVSSSNSFTARQQQQQPRLAVIGGLTTSRPVSGVAGPLATNLPQIRGASPAPGAVQPGTTAAAPAAANSPGRLLPPRPNSNLPLTSSRSSSLRLSQGSEDSSSGTPKVDDALKMLRAEARSAKSGSSGRSSPAPGLRSSFVRAVLPGGGGGSSGRSSPSPSASAATVDAAAGAGSAYVRAVLPGGGGGSTGRTSPSPATAAGAISSLVKAVIPGSNGGSSSSSSSPNLHAYAAVSGRSSAPVRAEVPGGGVGGANEHQKPASNSVAGGSSKSASAATAARAATPPSSSSSRDEAPQTRTSGKERRTDIATAANNTKAVSSSSSRPSSTGGSRSRGSSSSGSRAPAAAAASKKSLTAEAAEGAAKVTAPVSSGNSKAAMGARPGSSSDGRRSSTGKAAGVGANGNTGSAGRLGSSSGSRTGAGRSR